MTRCSVGVSLIALAAAATPSMAAVVIDQVTARPNPARFAKGYPQEIQVEVMIKDRGMTRILGCDVVVDFGDGTADVEQRFMDGGPRKAILRHVYRKAGSYALAVRGRSGGGGRPCEGERRVPLIVINEAEAAEAKAPKDSAAPTAGCPSGWSLVPGSQSGYRFRCRPEKTAKIECRGGTRYLEQDGIIGCE